jgi:hydrogenase maturation protease
MGTEKQLLRTLVIGYGNLDRADDGVAYHVVNALRRRLGQTTLSEENTGLEELGAEVDSIFLVQLTPELMDLLAGYHQVIFVDAHVYENVENLHCAPVIPEYAPSSFTHHMTPAMLLALLKLLNFPEPAGHLVSIRGYDFNFHRDLSPETMALVESAVEHILHLMIPCPAGIGA